MRISQLVCGRLLWVLLTGLLCAGYPLAVPAAEPAAPAKPEAPKVKIVQGGESHRPAGQCRKMIVGPGVNQPDPFPGYGGFVGWECPARLRNGTMYVTFNAGYWHASPPTPVDPECVKEWKKIGFPENVDAPRGGRAVIAKSTDGGKTWESAVRRMPPVFTLDATDGPVVELPDKTILLAGEGKEKAPGRWVIGIFESTDQLELHAVLG